MSADENAERLSEPGTDPGVPAAEAGAGLFSRFAGSTAVGLVREHNEDNFAIANLTSGDVKPRDEVCEEEIDARGLMFAVCDGMGGAAAGEVASKMAVDILIEAMRRGDAPKDRDDLARRLVRAVEEAGKRIYESAQKERSRRGMGTTATVAVLVDKVLFVAEVGDSRAYLLRRGELKQVTKDQSLVNQLIEAGHLTEDEAEAFEHSNIILQALGTSENVQVDLTFVELRKGDRLMMCSDGLSGLVHLDTLRQTLEDVEEPAECATRLIEYAEQGGGHDNITVIVADFDGEDLQPAAVGDTFGYVQYPLPLEDGQSSAFVDEETVGGGLNSRGNSGAAAAAAMPASPDTEGDAYESTYPLPSEEADSRGSIFWLLGGVIALVIAGFVWFSLEPAAKEAHREDDDSVSAAREPLPAPPEPAPVRVNVHTDVENAELVVNGETKGDLSAELSRTLDLRPGAYRFEARRNGDQLASTVVTVRGDTPMDVFLKLPVGTSDSSPDGVGEQEGDEDGLAAEQDDQAPTGSAQQPRGGDPGASADDEEERTVAAEPVKRVRRPKRERASVTPKVVEPGEPAPTPAEPKAEAKPAPKQEPATQPQAKPAPPAQPKPAVPPAEPPAPEGIPDNPF